MKNLILLFLIALIYSCSAEEKHPATDPEALEYQWLIPKGKVTGNFNLFPLAKNPTFKKVTDVNSLPNDALVAMLSFNNEIRVYPYEYIRLYESVNDKLGKKNFALTYCPITKSAVCWDTNFEGTLFTLRASGYLLNDNVVLYDEKSDTYWSQMLALSIKGKYAGEPNATFNLVETTWGTVKSYFKNAAVFTDTSVKSHKSSLKDIVDGKRAYGILNKKPKSTSEVYMYKYEEFKNEITVYQNRVGANNIIVIGSDNYHFITSYINDNNAIYTSIQGSFPIVMKDNKGNLWDIFGIASSGPRKGEQLESPIGFVALGWAWKAFYDDFVFNK